MAVFPTTQSDPLADLRKRLHAADPLSDLRALMVGRDFAQVYGTPGATEAQQAISQARVQSIPPAQAAVTVPRQAELRPQPTTSQRLRQLAQQAVTTATRPPETRTGFRSSQFVSPTGIPDVTQTATAALGGALQLSGAVGKAVGETVAPFVRQMARRFGLPWSNSETLARISQVGTEVMLDLANLILLAPGVARKVIGRALVQVKEGRAFQRALGEAAEQEALRATLPASRGGTALEIPVRPSPPVVPELRPIAEIKARPLTEAERAAAAQRPVPFPGQPTQTPVPIPVEPPRPAARPRPRLPEMGAQVIYKGDLYRVESVGPRGLSIVDVQTGRRRISPVAVEDVRIVPPDEVARTPMAGRVIPEQPQVAPTLSLEGQEAAPLPTGQQKGLFGERPQIVAGQPRPARPAEEMTLAEFVRANGGIKPTPALKGEIDALRPKESGTTGLVNAKGGVSAGEMARLAKEAGFPVEGEADLITRLHENLRGKIVLSSKSVSRIEQEVERKYRSALEGVGPLDYLTEEGGALRVATFQDRAGHITLLKPPRDLTPWQKWVGSPSRVFQLDDAARQIQRRAEMFEVARKRETARLLAIRQRATQRLTAAQKVRVLQALDGQALDGTALDVSSYVAGLAEPERQAYTAIRKEILDETGRKFRQRGQLGQGVTDYFPHVFRGRWKMVVEDAPEATQFFETQGTALTAARKMLDATPSANVTVRFEGFAFPEEVATLLSRKGYFRLVSQLQKAVGKDVLTKDDIIRATRGAAAIRKPPQRFFGHLEPRIANLQTFDHDLDRALDTYIVGAVKKLETDTFRADALKLREAINPDLRNLLSEVDDYIADVTGIPGATEASLDTWLVRTFGTVERPTRRYMAGTAGVVAKLKLGYNPISATVNLTQTVTNTYPVLGARWTGAGVRGSVDHFRRGTQSSYAQVIDALGIRFYDSKAFGDDLVYLAHETPLNAMYMFNKAEEVNRAVAGIGAYERGINELHLLPADAIEYARNVVQRTQFTYSAADLPKLLRNPFGRVLGQFRAFTIKELEFIHSLRGLEIPRFVLAAATTGALVVTPHVLAVNAVVKKATGKDILADLRQRFPRLVRGVPGLLGVDLSERIGIGSDIEFMVTDLRPERLLGPTVGTVTEIVRAARRYLESASEDNAYGFIRALAPTQFRYLTQAYQAAQRKAKALPGEVRRVLRTGATEGGTLVGFRGRPVTDLSPAELALKAVGFRTVREGQISDLVERAVERENEVERIRAVALDHAAALRAQGRPWSQVIVEANKRLPTGSKLTLADVERVAALRRRLLTFRTLRRLPRGIRPEFRQQFQEVEESP